MRIDPFCRALTASAALAVLAIGLLLAPARANEAEALAFYQGKQIRFYTMGSPGGGFDAYTRTLSTFLDRKLGTRSLTANEPTAGGLIAMNRTVNAPADGLTILLTGGEALVTGQLFGLAGANYDVSKQVFLARVSSEAKVAVMGSPSPYRSVADMQRAGVPVIWAGSGKADGNSDFSAIMGFALGIKTRIIIGYRGSADMNLAIQRGEVDGRVVSDEAAALFGTDSGMRVVATLARRRTNQFPEVPTIFETVQLTSAQARLIDWRASIAGLGRLLLVTPGTPADRVDLLRKVFAEIIRDPEFIAEMKKFNLSANYASHEDVRTTVEGAMTMLDASGLAEVREIALDRYY